LRLNAFQAQKASSRYYKGVDKFFKTLAKLESSSVFSLAKSENNWPKI
jgi:hypothetical protein